MLPSAHHHRQVSRSLGRPLFCPNAASNACMCVCVLQLPARTNFRGGPASRNEVQVHKTMLADAAAQADDDDGFSSIC